MMDMNSIASNNSAPITLVGEICSNNNSILSPRTRRSSITLPTMMTLSPGGNANRKRPHSEMATLHQPMKPLSASITLPIGNAATTVSLLQCNINNIPIPAVATAAAPLSTTATPALASIPGSPATVAIVDVAKRVDNRKVISSPQEFFTAMLQSRGYPGTTFCSLKCGYHNNPTKHQTLSYGVSLTRAIRSSDITTAQSLLASGLHPNACNKFGESIVHAACRRGDYAMLSALIDAGSCVQVTDDFGRTPLHDACWTSSPNFDAIRLLLDRDPWLLCIMDCRGSTPLGYARKAHWGVWIGFLGAIADRYWPDLTNAQNPQSSSDDSIGKNDVPPLAFMEPNSRPLPDPKAGNTLNLEVIEHLANGTLTPQDLNSKDSACNTVKVEPQSQEQDINNRAVVSGVGRPTLSRITLDPLRMSGSNATTMIKRALAQQRQATKNNNDAAFSGFVQVAATSAHPVL